MIYLTTTASTIDGVLEQIQENALWISGVELRVDLLDEDERPLLARVPELVRERWGARLKLLSTVRRVADGGRSADADHARLALQRAAVEAGFDYVDLEGDLPEGNDHAVVVAAARRAGVTVVRSWHDFERVPDDLDDLLRTLPRSEHEIAKIAVTPTCTADLVRIVAAADRLGDRRRIVLGMGRYGFPTRVLARRLGNELTFASPAGQAAAPGHVAPEVLATRYRVSSHDERTRYFAVIGDPIEHSKSPDYHNARFTQDDRNACYLPILVDDVDAFFQLAEQLPILGCSVTIPHKQAVIAHLTESGADVRALGACNTLLRVPEGWRGVNTDVIGFLAPLEEVRPRPLHGARVLVLGAGGAARAVVYALASRGAKVSIFNRTLEKAVSLANELASSATGGPIEVVEADDSGVPLTEPIAEIVVNTTSLGMHNEGDPAPWYRFRGTEVVYDIVYTPPETPMIRRAVEAGCRAITGDRMFAAQAAAQYELYRTPASTGADSEPARSSD
ncbi:MAG: shikimate dehydrogenase [Spirochaetota bacterium]